ncbi:MBL fold metallo-hydrolase [Salinirubrum litoreum]|uniref:MBL fold metallo-hydrolase n=1 Tax=Salinirubrum litoreum TaxID=1126234 RepID=A0ABD5RDQ3_9EURY|nr:MBL fold metallo-hydrolase [Salinirubrum litoreum]
MELSFQHANPGAGNESTILRIDGLLPDQPVCLLVDAGAGVDVADALGPDEYLTGILLTHAHLDHYRSLGENLVDGAPIYAATPTATVLDRVLDLGVGEYDLSNVDAVRNALEPVADWTTIVEGLELSPLPAGHTLGAAGFLLRIEDDDETVTVLVTGDFTRRHTAGYEPMPGTLPVDVDVLVVNAVTREQYAETLDDALDTLLSRARAGSRVVAATSGLRGVQIAYQLGHLADDLDVDLPIRVVGQAARLAETLDYDVPNVEWVPTFADADDVLEPGGVTVSGPEVPVGGSTAVLYREIADDPDATFVQLTGGGTDDVTGTACTTARYVLSNHPTRETVDELVTTLAPIHVVVNHQTGRGADRYKDEYRSYVWAPSDERAYTLRDDTGWTAPPWVTEQTKRLVWEHRREHGPRVVESGDDLPTPGRVDTPDLAAEGVDVARFRREYSDTAGSDADAGADRAAVREATSADSTRSEVGSVPTSTGDSAAPASDSTSAADGSGGQSGDDSPPASSADGPSTRVVLARLARLEAALDGEVHDATVVDAGDDVTLLRLADVPAGLEHGDEVGVRIVPEFDR